MTHQLIIPQSFDAREFLPRPLWDQREDAWYFMHVLMRKLAVSDVDKWGCVRLMAKHLGGIMLQRTYSRVIDALVCGGAVERFPFLTGVRSYGFRPCARFVGDAHIRVEVTDRRLIKRLQRFYSIENRKNEADLKPVHRQLIERQKDLRIDGQGARQTLKSLPKRCNLFDSQGIQVADIEQREFRLKVGTHGRVTNNITTLKRQIRRHLRTDTDSVTGIDVSCAQPAFLARLILRGEEGRGRRGEESTYTNNDSGFWKYAELTQTGRLYDYLMERLPETGLTREQIKRRFLCDVIAKKGRYPSDVEKLFAKEFPSVYRFIRNVNGRDHSTLVRMLQREESGYVIETVANNFMQRFPDMFIASLHDSLFVESRNISRLRSSFEVVFERERFPMTLKVEA